MLQLPHRRALMAGGYDPARALGPDLIAWLDAGRPDLMTFATGVSSWKDIVAGYVATQGTAAARPVYSAASFNGAPALTFDGVDDVLTCADAALLAALPTGVNGSELWALVQQDALAADAAQRNVVSYWQNTSQTSRRLGRTASSGVNRILGLVGNGTTTPAGAGALVDVSTRHVLRMQVQTPAGTTFLSVDGVSDGSLSSDPSAVGAPVRFRIGASSLMHRAPRRWRA